MVNLYNDYQIYLTVESLLCKDILATVGGVVEAALFDKIYGSKTKADLRLGPGPTLWPCWARRTMPEL